MTRYLFFAVVGTALFWGLYRLLLRREHCLSVNRFFLLATLGLSLLLPLVHPQVAVVAPSAGWGGGWSCLLLGSLLLWTLCSSQWLEKMWRWPVVWMCGRCWA